MVVVFVVGSFGGANSVIRCAYLQIQCFFVPENVGESRGKGGEKLEKKEFAFRVGSLLLLWLLPCEGKCCCCGKEGKCFFPRVWVAQGVEDPHLRRSCCIGIQKQKLIGFPNLEKWSPHITIQFFPPFFLFGL